MDSRHHDEYSTTPRERSARRAQRIAARRARERARRRRLLLRAGVLLAAAIALYLLSTPGEPGLDGIGMERLFHQQEQPSSPSAQEAAGPEKKAEPYALSVSASTAQVGQELPSAHAVVIDVDSGTILAQKAADAAVSPASMTKVLTLLVAAQALDEAQLYDTVTIDMSITDYCFVNGCSVAGFERGESVPVLDLLYGCILPSGAEASLALANYVAGSHEAFVALMNEKVRELGLAETARFTNCVGLYDPGNVCTVADMAVILKAALDNDLARRVLTTKVYEIPPNRFHEEGMVLSNWFLRRIEDHVDEGIQVLGGKTGFVSESGNCAASYAETADGGRYICVTANASGAWQCIRDHVQLYRQAAGAERAEP